MKEVMKADRISNENSLEFLMKYSMKTPALIMKEAMKAPNIPNEIFNESTQH